MDTCYRITSRANAMSICPTFGDVKIDEWIMGVVNFHSMVLAAIDDYCVSSLFGVVK